MITVKKRAMVMLPKILVPVYKDAPPFSVQEYMPETQKSEKYKSVTFIHKIK